ncbi:MAG TPA: ABC transporter substrate-binding protein [Steroidobacteraceae bacterium]|nr:ABC transporter substrate-binding protein [Steroidobacteraceae bacterium]
MRLARRRFLQLTVSAAALPALPPDEARAAPAVPLKAAIENPSFEWFFLLVDAGKEQGIWTKHGLDLQFTPAAGSAAQLRERVDAGIKLGIVNTAEVLLARSNGTAVKIVASYFGETTARIFVAASGPLKTGTDLDGKRVGIVATTHTSYRTVRFMNRKLGINAEPVPLGRLPDNVAALSAGRIDAFYSAEGAALALVDSGSLRVLLPLSDLYPKPYAAVSVWITEDLINDDPGLAGNFVTATLETVGYLKANLGYASSLYVKRTKAPQDVADRAIASLNQVLTASGRGSGHDLVAAVAGNWQFTVESGAVPAGTTVRIEDAVDTRFLPPER